MPLHLVKLCVGASSIEDLERWQAMSRNKRPHQGRRVAFHTTFQKPTRDAELIEGGSLYWVIKGTILVRQPIVGFGEGKKEDGSPCCLILLDPALTAVRPVPRRAFQGWRYLTAADAPPDAKAGAVDDIAAMPPKMRKSLADLGLL
ncbi:MAG: DUF1489 domain-containing protein [Hyphomicrobium sp.]|nr:DUF1489 domain-containing protein [Hyphomicrobium sp.]